MKLRKISKSSIEKLLLHQGQQETVLSIYMPTHPKSHSSNMQADKIRFKNAMHTAEEQLEQAGLRKDQRAPFMQQMQELDKDLEFWKHQDKGLAIFVSSSELKAYALPIEVQELTLAGGTFILAPLVVVKDMFQSRYVLSLNLSKPQLFRVSLQSFYEQHVPDMPEDFEEALQITGYEQQQQFHSVGNGNTAMFHGHGAEKDNKEIEVANYMRIVDEAILDSKVLEPDDELIVAGTEKHAALFRDISKIKHISSYRIDGNFEEQPMDLKKLVQDHLRVNAENRMQDFDKEYASTDPSLKQSHTSPVLLQNAARQGMIKVLAVSMLEKTRDSVRTDSEPTYKLELDTEQEELLNLELLVQEVFERSGEVIAVNQKTVNSRDIHAVLRYATANT